MLFNENDPAFLDEFYHILMDSTAMWLNMLDRDARVVMWNRGAERISGYQREEVLGRKDIWELLYPDISYREKILAKVHEIIKQGDQLTDFETIIQCKDGSRRVLSWNSHDVKDRQGDVVGSLALGRDVTELHANNRKLKELTRDLERSNRRLYRLSAVDELTSLYNRRSMDSYLEEEWGRHRRSGKPLSLLYIDLDFFKQYNDAYGHNQGDKVLIEIAMIFNQYARRQTDRAARFGGEEFAIILPETTAGQAREIAETVRQAVESRKIPHKDSRVADTVTVSIGVATREPSENEPVDVLKNEADQALYKAKKNGRNRVESY